ncbi:MAG: hypothetical protein VX278_09455 [Myxococcota bacterium]|nr:hypothetical protein [Myxococcota bacterium]
MKKEHKIKPLVIAKGAGLVALGIVFALVADAVAQNALPDATTQTEEAADVTECLGSASSLLLYRKLALNRREKTLKNREIDIENAEERLKIQFTELEKIRAELRQTMKELDVVKEDRISKLKNRFEKMRAKNAAEILEKTEDVIAVMVLSEMKEAQAGKILAKMSAEKAAFLAEKLAQHPMNKEE